jgi:hypothetical protein
VRTEDDPAVAAVVVAAVSASGDETVEHIGYSAGAEPVYVVLHLPRRPVGAVVVCGSIGWESAKNYRREVLLGRRLAARGLATVRFHYRGLGESGGSFEQATLASMIEDAHQARALLGRRTGFARPGLVGIRTGALVAAALADGLGPVPVALWDPVVSGADYLRELTQIRRIWQVTHGVTDVDGDDGRAGAALGVLGYRLSGALVAGLREARLGPWAEKSPSPVLSLHVGAVPRSARAVWPVADRPLSRVESVPGRIDWWMKRPSFEPEEASPVTTALVGRTVEWLAEHTATEAGPASTAAPALSVLSATVAVGGGLREAVRVSADGDQLAGIFVEPRTEPRPALGTGDPGLAAVILNCGGYHSTSGPAGLWALLADALAELRVPSLRVAYRGVADSTGAVSDFDLTRPRTEELRAARVWLSESGFTRHVLLGGCLGARTCCAADLEGVAGLGLVSLPWHRESLGTGTDSRKDAAAGAPSEPAAWLNTGLLDDLRRCVAADVPLRIVYGETERYRRDLQAADEASALGPLPRHQLGLRSVAGPDSMFEPQAVSAELAAFVAGLRGRG